VFTGTLQTSSGTPVERPTWSGWRERWYVGALVLKAAPLAAHIDHKFLRAVLLVRQRRFLLLLLRPLLPRLLLLLLRLLLRPLVLRRLCLLLLRNRDESELLLLMRVERNRRSYTVTRIMQARDILISIDLRRQ
jgi:hypothetical protein